MYNKKDPKKYILAAGDSFTDPGWWSEFYPDHDSSYPKWPEVLGHKLGVDNVVNLGKSGACNEFIINKVIDHILHEEKPWLVVIGLSEAHRFSPYGWFGINPHVMGRRTVEDRGNWEPHDWAQTFFPNGEWLISRDQHNGQEIMWEILSNYVRQINRIVSFCHRLNIKIIISGLLWPVDQYDYDAYRAFHKLPKKDRWTSNAIAKMFMSCKGFDDVDPKTFVGWPIYPELGGDMFCTYENGYVTNMTVGPLDGHPNALGHQYIAEKYYEHYKKTY